MLRRTTLLCVVLVSACFPVVIHGFRQPWNIPSSVRGGASSEYDSKKYDHDAGVSEEEDEWFDTYPGWVPERDMVKDGEQMMYEDADDDDQDDASQPVLDVNAVKDVNVKQVSDEEIAEAVQEFADVEDAQANEVTAEEIAAAAKELVDDVEDVPTEVTAEEIAAVAKELDNVEEVQEKERELAAAAKEMIAEEVVETEEQPIVTATEERVIDLSSETADIQDESSGYIDRMELADAYDGDEEVGNLDDSTDDQVTAAAPSTIDKDTKTLLKRQLSYRSKEIEFMRPDVAAVVAAKRLHRPVEGMPRNWYRDGCLPPSSPKLNKRAIVATAVKVVVPAAIGMFAFSKGGDILDGVTDFFGSSHNEEEEPFFGGAGTAYDPLIVETEEEKQVREDDHFFPPPASSNQQQSNAKAERHYPEDELDNTWLDKIITAVGRKSKAFFRWEI